MVHYSDTKYLQMWNMGELGQREDGHDAHESITAFKGL